MALTLTAGYTWTSGEVDTATKRNSAAVPTVADGQTYAFGLGSAATPSVTFSGDPNTGFYSPAADQAAVAVGGVRMLAIVSSGITSDTDLAFSGTYGTSGHGYIKGPAAAGKFLTLQNQSATGGTNFRRSDGTEVGSYNESTDLWVFSKPFSASANFGANGNTPVGKQVSGGNIAGVIAGLVSIGLFSS